MSDLIDRQIAISAICSACGKIDCDKMDKCEKLQLPPASSSEIPNSSDTISRQAAIEALKNRQDDGKGDISRFYNTIIQHDIEAIEQLPPAQPERIKGRWIEYDYGLVACECSVCHEKYNLYEEDVFGRNFCPNCGAEMEVTT